MDGESDAEAGAFALDLGELFAGEPSRQSVTAFLALVVPSLGVKRTGSRLEIVRHGSGQWLLMLQDEPAEAGCL